MAGIASFKPGTWNGIEHDSQFVRHLADNFQKFSTGKTPYYTPYVSLNHKDELRCGFVDGASVDGGSVLRLDAGGIPEPVAQWRNAGGIVQPSIEYFEPVYDEAGNLVDGFRLPDGSISPTPVLKCLTLLGADAPAVKGLPDLPTAVYDTPTPQKFSDSCVRRFANADPTSVTGDTMDRAAMLQALQALGVDVTPFTDAVPDEVLKAVLDAMQKSQAAPVADATPGDGTQQMADLGTPAAVAPAAAPGIPGVSGNQQPSSVVLKFSDNSPASIAKGLQTWAGQVTGVLTALMTQANATQAHLAAVNGAAAQSAHAAKFSDVTAFVALLAQPDANKQVRIQPAQKEGIVRSLMRCDNTRIRKFSDGKTTGTELEEEKRHLLATLPKIRLGDKMADPAPSTPGGRVVGGGIDPDRRQRMLAATPQGRQILAAEAAKK